MGFESVFENKGVKLRTESEARAKKGTRRVELRRLVAHAPLFFLTPVSASAFTYSLFKRLFFLLQS